jgi:cytochrome P450
MPESLTAWLNPGMELFFGFQRRCRAKIAEIAKNHREKGPQISIDGRETLFDNVLSSNLPPQEKSEARLAQDMQVFVSAGAETTAKAISYILFYLHNEPELLKKLKAELEPLGNDPKLIELEQLPYLVSSHSFSSEAKRHFLTATADWRHARRNQVRHSSSPNPNPTRWTV